jgi:hypothetical protein
MLKKTNGVKNNKTIRPERKCIIAHPIPTTTNERYGMPTPVNKLIKYKKIVQYMKLAIIF